MWLDNDVWLSFSPRFSVGSNRPHGWPKPDIVSICTSPDFISNDLLQRLLKTTEELMRAKQRTDTEKIKMSNPSLHLTAISLRSIAPG
jgi:hypothetical protein